MFVNTTVEYLISLSGFYFLTVASKLKDIKIKFIVLLCKIGFLDYFSSFQYLIVIAYMYILCIIVYIICSFKLQRTIC